ncbi:hypothetical protein MVEN_00765100 [Mycena venus]|uniref:Uncharacterized protein n=1 Tax=Mycena venus TaxID=2733690 RepID=A0A8H7D348_9AGAR|nr:hypothetical protein MVEN_00765100 [Mycena venus]
MLYPQRTRESADARAALMARLPSQYPLEFDDITRIRTRYLQAERRKPYRVPTSSKRNLMGECRKRRLASSLGWGAFLKDETLRTPEGKVVRLAQEPCPIFTLPCVAQKLSEECLLRRDCRMTGDTVAPDCIMSLRTDLSSQGLNGVRRLSVDGEDDCEMPSWESSDYTSPDMEMDSAASYWGCGAPESGEIGEQLCVKAADEMFMMFIDETCMEVFEGN